MIGYYKSDKNDSIWTCYLKEKIQSIQNFRTGELRSYYPNGNINIKADSINGEYLYIKHSKRGGIIKQIKSGPVYKESKVFDNKGKLLEHIVFKNDIPYNIFISSKEDKDLVLEGDVDKGNGFINVKLRDFLTEELYTKEYFQIKDSKPDGEYKEFNEKGKVLVSGQYKNGFMDGEWFLTNPKKIIHYSSNDSIDYDTVMNIGLQLDYQVYNIEVMPKFNGGEPALEFRKYIGRSLIYPVNAAMSGDMGRVIVQFKVNKIGKVVNAEVVAGISKSLDQEAIRVVTSSPYWRPRLQDGIPEETLFTFPINFVLQ
jgi:TonB family protein